MRKVSLVALVTVGLLAPLIAQADVNIGITVAPPPPLVVAAPPPIVVVPGTTVHHVPSVSFNVFVFGGRYYSFHNGAWFYAASHKERWKAIAIERVPQPVLAVPVSYYKIPPGHAKKMKDGGHGGPPGHGGPGHGKGPKGK